MAWLQNRKMKLKKLAVRNSFVWPIYDPTETTTTEKALWSSPTQLNHHILSRHWFSVIMSPLQTSTTCQRWAAHTEAAPRILFWWLQVTPDCVDLLTPGAMISDNMNYIIWWMVFYTLTTTKSTVFDWQQLGQLWNYKMQICKKPSTTRLIIFGHAYSCLGQREHLDQILWEVFTWCNIFYTRFPLNF